MLQITNMLREKKIIVFGTGNAAKTILKKYPLKVDYYVDNDPGKWQKEFLTKPVKSPEELITEVKGNFIVLIASMYHEEISEQLENMGYRVLYDYLNAFDLFINPLGYDESLAVYEETARIDEKILNLLKLGFYSHARLLLSDYQKLAPYDERVVAYMKLIALKENKLDELEQAIYKDIEDSNSRNEYNIKFNIALKYEREGKFLDSIETFEKLLSETYDDSVREELVRRINVIANGREDELIKQLRERKHKINKSGIYNLHILFDSMHGKSFIDFINEYFDAREHLFLVFYYAQTPTYITEDSNLNVHAIRVADDDYESISSTVQLFLNKSKQVTVHYLHDLFCWLIVRCDTDGIKLNWRLWGGDNYTESMLYDSKTYTFLNSINFFNNISTNKPSCKQRDIQRIYRKAAIRKMSSIIVGIKGEYDSAVSNNVTSAKYAEAYNPLRINFQMLDEAENCKPSEIKEKFKYVVLLGNSGDPSNNHLEVIHKLKAFKDDSFCVVTPLAYGNQSYIDNLIVEGKRILGEKFIPLTELMEQKEYSRLLSSVDVAIMNHNRSQAMGNIISLLYLKKKIYIKSGINSVQTLESYGLKLFNNFFSSVSSFNDMIRFDEEIGTINRRIVKERFSKDTLVEKYKQIFEQ